MVEIQIIQTNTSSWYYNLLDIREPDNEHSERWISQEEIARYLNRSLYTNPQLFKNFYLAFYDALKHLKEDEPFNLIVQTKDLKRSCFE